MVRLILILTLLVGCVPARADRALILFDISSSVDAYELLATAEELDHGRSRAPADTILEVWPWADRLRFWSQPVRWQEGAFVSILPIAAGNGGTYLGFSLERATEWSRHTEPFCLQAIVVVDGKPDDQQRFSRLLVTLGRSDFLAILPTKHDGTVMQASALAFYAGQQTSARYVVRPFSANSFLEAVDELRAHRCEYLGG